LRNGMDEATSKKNDSESFRLHVHYPSALVRRFFRTSAAFHFLAARVSLSKKVRISDRTVVRLPFFL
jgi:hypothetical protein